MDTPDQHGLARLSAMTTWSSGSLASLAAKLDAFALTLPVPEQVLLAELVSGCEDKAVFEFGARPIWPGLLELVVDESSEPPPAPC